MHLTDIYESLSHPLRIRIVGLLAEGPLCVCHFQKVLKAPQVAVSKHLGYLKQRGVVVARRSGAWMIYSLPARPSPVLATNLACLHEALRHDEDAQRDAARAREVRGALTESGPLCGAPKSRKKQA